MADCFISYRRLPSAPVATLLQSKLESRHKIDAYVDTTRTDGSQVTFPERLMQAIEDAPVFICLLGERDGQHTLESEWVLKEIQRAYELQKFCIPVFQESYRPLSDIPEAVEYLLGFDGVHVFDQKNIMIDESVRSVAELIQPFKKTGTRRRAFLSIGTILCIVVAVLVLFLFNRDNDNGPIPSLTTSVALVNTTTASRTPGLSGFQQLQTTEAELTQSAGTQAALELTVTERFISDANSTATAAQFAATETSAFATLLALSSTPTLSPTPTLTLTPSSTPTLAPEQIASTPQTVNSAWTPVERDFDGVTMVLVPAGCFMMGSSDGQSDEQPVYEQCFDQHFWIDKYEVTQAQFRQVGGTQANAPGFSGDDRPVERITWFEARDFCALREARLPTEAEWEYAARGPDALVYPWGDTWDADNAVWNRSSSQGTANVGSLPAGRSWVGALDMSGNVWEWTTSLYAGYPYAAEDGREADTGDRTDALRVLRGGSWGDSDTDFFRAAVRLRFVPDFWNDYVGFRCARSR